MDTAQAAATNPANILFAFISPSYFLHIYYIDFFSPMPEALCTPVHRLFTDQV